VFRVVHEAPAVALPAPSTLTTIVHRALERANLHPIFRGAHLLRHSLATSHGFRCGGDHGENRRNPFDNPSREHQLKIYAKGRRRESRAQLAQPWPIGGWTVTPKTGPLRDYITIRRSLGFRLRLPGKFLKKKFFPFCKPKVLPTAPRNWRFGWAMQPTEAQPSTWAWASGNGATLRQLAQR